VNRPVLTSSRRCLFLRHQLRDRGSPNGRHVPRSSAARASPRCATALRSKITCLEDHASAPGIVRDVGNYLTADPLPIGIDRNGCYTRRLQTWAALGPGHPSDRCHLNPCQGRGQARLGVYVCRNLYRPRLSYGHRRA
jgi:hypothetical protein